MICDITEVNPEESVDSSQRMQGYIALMGGYLTPEQVAGVCYLNFYGLIVNTLALVGLAVALVYVSWKYEWKRYNLLALHNLRFSLVLASILVSICEVAQYAMIVHQLAQIGHQEFNREQTYPDETPRLAELERREKGPSDDDDVPMVTAVFGLCSVCLGLISILVAAAFVRVVELRDEFGLLYIVMTIQGAQSVAKWCKYEYVNGAVDTVVTLPTSLAFGSALTLVTTAVIDGITVHIETSSSRRHNIPPVSKGGTGYKSSSSPFLSRITFWWIAPLLWRGYVEPLELDNLGTLPETETSRYHYDQFLSIYQSYKNSTSLWGCYVLNCWRMFLAGGVFKLLGDLCGLVGPLCISNIVDYIAKPVTSSSPSAAILAASVIPPDDIAPSEYNLQNQSLVIRESDEKIRLAPLTWAELLANGWFVALVVLVFSLAQGTFSQASTHLMDMEGTRLKNALQGLVYRKTLLLSASCFYPTTAIRTEQKQSGPDCSNSKCAGSGNNEFAVKNNQDRNSTENRKDINIGYGDRASTRDNPGSQHANTELGTDVCSVLKSEASEPLAVVCSKEEIKHKVAAIVPDDQQQFDKGTAATKHSNNNNNNDNGLPVLRGVRKEATIDGATVATEIEQGNRNAGSRVEEDHKGGNGDTAAVGVSAAADAGTITNLMSDDAFNVMSFVKIAHYVWAIPLKIGVVMYLLYQLLGVSAVIGSVVCIVTMTPLQFLIGKMMSENSKKASECTDERLRRINEVLLGIKLIKLSAWEGVFREKISHARRRELKHLDLDSCYWTLMMLLTHISSVLITFVTVAVFTHLEEELSATGELPREEPGKRIQFTAARLFASLALFNQLTVPLFVFPITIPIILSAAVSTTRLETFLRRPEVAGRDCHSATGSRAAAWDLSKSDASLDVYDENEPENGVQRQQQDGAQREENATLRSGSSDPLVEGAKPDIGPAASAKVGDNLCCEPSERQSENEQRQEVGTKVDDIVAAATAANCGSLSLCRDDSAYEKDCCCRCGDQKCTPFGNSEKYHRTDSVLELGRDTDPPPGKGCARLKKNRPRRKSHEAVAATNELRLRVAGSSDNNDEPLAVFIGDGCFQWGCVSTGKDTHSVELNSRTAGLVLRIEQLSIPKGKLTVIVGRSGSGKSSLLAALLKEINHLSGDVIWSKYSTIAYVPQRPWLLNANVRDNILFGEPYRPKRYERVLKACALKPDIELMPDGDMSEIGERGIKLSGGQRQRIVIARALYSAANVVIMDDPLSSLDNEVGKFVFDNGIRRMLTRQKRTIIMVTQDLQLVFRADNIIVMEGFAVCATGTLSAIENNHPEKVRQWKTIITREQQSNETQLSPGKTARERWKLFRNVSRISLQRMNVAEDYYMPRSALLYGASSALKGNPSLFGSRFHTHDFPLPIDDCHGENVQLRRHYSKRYRNDSRAVRGHSDGVVPSGRKLADEPPPSGAHGNVGAYRTQSLQAKRVSKNANESDGRLLPVTGRHTSSSSTELNSQTAENRLPLATYEGENNRRYRFSDTCREFNKIGFRQFLRRMSSRKRRLRSYSNPTDLRMALHGQRRAKAGEDSFTKSVADEEQLRHTESHIKKQHSARRLLSNVSRYSEETEEESYEDFSGGDVSNRLIYDEERKYGKIPARIYWLYLKSCGPNTVTIFFTSALAQQGLRVYTDFWLQNWTERTQQNIDGVDSADITYNFRVYALLSGVCILMAAISFPTGQLAGSNARRRLHRLLMVAVLKNTLHFFQTIPLGRIMNRLSIDIAVVDKKIAATSQKLLQFILLCLCAVLINSVVTPYFILLTIPICGVYYIVQKFYRCSSRELQRIESITYTPIIAHFSETIDGVTTIRAYQQESRFTELLFRRMEANNVAQVILNCSNRWLGIALDYLGAVIVFVAILSALITARLNPGTISSSLIGLAINYALLVPIYLNWVVKLTAEMEMYVGAVERIQLYIDSSQQRIRERSKIKYKVVPISWPQKGDIVFENVSLRYEGQEENVITNLNLNIPTGQRIGICGRTGSGKSSLALALFGALELTGGRILIDDVDIGSVHTDELRCRLSIIPQEVMLFGGSLRENLDPRGHFSDLELWNCLEMAQLKDIVVALPAGLDTQVSEDRNIFSAGQRQLFFLARAYLRGSMCLVLDEATSSLDSETEKLVLNAAGRAFKGRTVLTIAHRLHALFDYDRVIVLEQGRIVEDGCPRVLRKKSDSKFATMLKASTDYQQLLRRCAPNSTDARD
ncbi:ATP-binding cassette sub-family C member Sur isoform X2 [Toxorhynchites rutilus septentrionalis]|uniref:ATP-binding cassette sub-family C member Sur isoform X2 n=1 Tax=Toxorhynchites rutilus septentrionalis TaxID=329112 RepID=UPI002479D188|nr:ATP-binding cassette sub-family C member Sur isoform X2 [Toxorhynchites rutilus septentrionalis]